MALLLVPEQNTIKANSKEGDIMMAKRLGFFMLVAVVSMVFCSNAPWACLAPTPLDGWQYGGDVTPEGASIRLGDHEASWSYLYKFVYHERGLYTLSFDFKNELSPIPYEPGSDGFSFLDSFFASVYFINECSRFDLQSCSFDYVLPLFDMDYEGPFKVYRGQVGPSTLGDDWLHYQTTFSNHFHKIIPTFELFDENYIDNDSAVLIANVNISQVPLPTSLLFMGSGILVLAGRRLRNRSRPRK
ncbi:hypothetical protein DRN32_02605 [Thermococci archaeon]|nr:MAG: hypothetical protein DRN32_02605 [Thermococci archaeon]